MARTTLNLADMQALKTGILADAALTAYVASGNVGFIAAYLNAASTTDAWQVNMPAEVSDEAANYTTFDSLTAGKRDSWALFLRFPRDFSKAKVRSWITDVWGAANAGSVAEAVLHAGVEKATKAEALVGGTSRTTGTVSALDRNWIGAVTPNDISTILG